MNHLHMRFDEAVDSAQVFLATHAALSKDKGLINPDSGKATSSTTPRGMTGGNFAKPHQRAIAETRRQWQDFGRS